MQFWVQVVFNTHRRIDAGIQPCILNAIVTSKTFRVYMFYARALLSLCVLQPLVCFLIFESFEMCEWVMYSALTCALCVFSDLIHCTNEMNVNVPQLADTLFERTTNSSWVVVFKALITTHHLMMYGNEVRETALVLHSVFLQNVAHIRHPSALLLLKTHCISVEVILHGQWQWLCD